MGEIYLASLRREGGFEKALAIKRILPHLAHDESFVRMFEAEARLTALLNHPNIVQIYDFTREGGEAWIAMELVDGFDLRSLLDMAREEGVRLPPGLGIRIIADCARALDYAHRREGPDGAPLRIVHRDVSPQNILISMEGETKLTDFGLAKALAVDQASMSGMLKGKLAYMPPEQIRGEAPDARADVFAAGAVLYELLGARRLYPEDLPVTELVRRVSNAEFEPLAAIAPDLDADACAVVSRCLEAAPADRYPTAADLERDLRAAATRLGVSETTRGLAEFVKRFEARRRVLLHEDGTIVSRKPIVDRDDVADTIAAPVVDEARDPAAPSGRPWLPIALGLAAVAALAAGFWPEARQDPRPEPQPPPELPVVTPRRSAESTEATRRPRRASEVPGSRAFVRVRGAPAGASCFARDVLRDTSRPFDCAKRVALEPGPHRVAVTVEGSDPFTQDVVLVAGGTRTVAFVAPDAPPQPCKLRITSTPGDARVTVDGNALDGRTPVDVPGLSPGEHAIRVNRRGYVVVDHAFVCEPGAPESWGVELVERQLVVQLGETRKELRVGRSMSRTLRLAGVNARIRILARLRGVRITIDAQPFASVSLDGRARGDTPVVLRTTIGNHTLKLERDGRSGSVPLRISAP